jgi:hypothetical protein
MLIINDVLISDSLANTNFACNTAACHGACCIEGDSGAPLEKEEIGIIAEHLDVIKPFMEPEGLALLEKSGFHEIDSDNDVGTTCLPSGACVFVKHEGLTATCAIENAHRAGALPFVKPISCHLYPIRVKQIGEYTALNYHKWDICAPACSRGQNEKILLSDFLQEPLIRKFGQEWYSEFKLVMDQLNQD